MKVFHFDAACRMAYARNNEICLVKDGRSNYEELHRHEYYELVYVYEGSGMQIINGVAHPVEAGDVLLLRPEDNHSFYAMGSLLMINLCFVRKDNLAHFPLQQPDSPITHLSEDSKIEMETLLYLMERELCHSSPDSPADTAATACLDWILLVMSRHVANPKSYDPLWGPLLAYISEHYNTVTLSQAVEMLGVSTSHFCRIFKRDFGMTFHTYVDNVRMQRAKYLLTHTSGTVAEISESVGYASGPCRFYQDFKSIVGSTPSAYRKLTQVNATPMPFESFIPERVAQSKLALMNNTPAE